MKKQAISFIWYYLIASSSDGPALFISVVSKFLLQINCSFFFTSLLFNPPDLVAVLWSRCCCHSCKDAIVLPFFSCLTSTQTQDMLLFFTNTNEIIDDIPEKKRVCEPAPPPLTSINIPASNISLMRGTGRLMGSGGRRGDHMQFPGV